MFFKEQSNLRICYVEEHMWNVPKTTKHDENTYDLYN
jgi:hypothetical protein